jgi:hypothetical protein
MKHVIERLITFLNERIAGVEQVTLLEDDTKVEVVRDMMVVYNTEDRGWFRDLITEYLDVNGYEVIQYGS